MPNPDEVAGALPFDANRKEIQIGSTFLTSDATATPLQSPINLGAGVTTINIPAGAAEFIVFPVTSNLIVAETSALAAGGMGDQTPKGAKEAFPCATVKQIFLFGTTGDVVYFRFTMLGVK